MVNAKNIYGCSQGLALGGQWPLPEVCLCLKTNKPKIYMVFYFYCLELLCDSVELCKCSRLTDSVYSQCESGDYGFSVQSSPQR